MHIEVNGEKQLTLHYWDHQGTEYQHEAGTTLVFIHGLGANGAIWQPCMQGLVAANQELRCLAIDLPNHGESDRVDAPEMQILIDAINQFIIQLGLEQVHLVGHSFGACLLIHSNNNPLHTRRVKQYHLLSPIGIQPMTDRQKAFVKSIYDVDFLMRFGKEGSYKSFQKYFVDYEPEYDRIWENIEPDIERHPENYYKAVHALANSVMDTYELQETSIFEKVQFIIGRKDIVVPFKALGSKTTLEDLREDGRVYFPNSIWELLPECGHYPQIERKEQVVELIIQEL